MKRDGQVWAFVSTGDPYGGMGPTFVGHVDVLDSSMGPLGLLGLISQSTQFTLFNFVALIGDWFKAGIIVICSIKHAMKRCICSFSKIGYCSLNVPISSGMVINAI